ncbi:MAG: hypothetical protein E7671_05060 [Ruminococcaceae bacterium]|nr:hypothetical protein [Oscillospiraceae bacterium]
MKKFIFGTVLACSAFLAVFAISFSLDNTLKYNRLSSSASNQLSDIKVRLTRLEDENTCFVVLLEYDGIIGIYDGERKYLLGTINTPVKTLPEADRARLADGIEVKNSSRFISLFEDFSN